MIVLTNGDFVATVIGASVVGFIIGIILTLELVTVQFRNSKILSNWITTFFEFHQTKSKNSTTHIQDMKTFLKEVLK